MQGRCIALTTGPWMDGWMYGLQVILKRKHNPDQSSLSICDSGTMQYRAIPSGESGLDSKTPSAAGVCWLPLVLQQTHTHTHG